MEAKEPLFLSEPSIYTHATSTMLLLDILEVNLISDLLLLRGYFLNVLN